MDLDFEKTPSREVDITSKEVGLAKQLIKEISNPLDLVRECISNSAAKEVGAKQIRITIYLHPEYGYVFEFLDDGCGMNSTGTIAYPGRLEKFLHLGFSSIVGISSDEFGWKGLGSKLAFRSRRIEIETFTKDGLGYKVWINEPWSSIERGLMPKAHITELPSNVKEEYGTSLKIFGYPADRLEEVRQGKISFAFEHVKDYLLHRSFVGFTRERENPPNIELRVENRSETLEVGFPVLEKIKAVKTPGLGTNYIETERSKVVSGSNRTVKIRLKGLYTLKPEDWGLTSSDFSTGLILSVKGIPYCNLDIRKFTSGYFVTNPGPDKTCIICECDDIHEDMNIARSNYNPSALTGVFEELLKELLMQLGNRPEYGQFVKESRDRKLKKKADEIRDRKDELIRGRSDVYIVEKDGSELWLHTKPQNENDTLAVLWKLEALGKLPFAEFKTLASSRSGPDLIVNFQETEQSQPELLTTIEAEWLFRNYQLHGHSSGQMPIVVCWDIGKDCKVKIRKTDEPWKYLADIDNVTVRIFTLRHLEYLRIKEQDR